MNQLTESSHFVPDAGIVAVVGTSPVASVCSQLDGRGMSGFVVTDDTAPGVLVRADSLVREVILGAHGDPARLRSNWQAPVNDFIGELKRSGGLVEIDASPVDVHSDATVLQNQPDRVFVVQEGGRNVGWFLNHEGVMEVTTTRVIYVCSNEHRNTDPDHGTCSYCPFPFVRTEIETR